MILVFTILFSGCNQGGAKKSAVENNQSSSTDSVKDDSNKASSGEKVIIEYWHVNAETQGGVTVEELVKKFNEQNDHIEVIARYNPDMYKGLMQNLQAEVATGTYPAVVQIEWAFVDYFSNNFEFQEQLADALGIFLMRQSMRGVPNSIIEYAHLESIGHGKMLKDIILPMIKPNIISTGIIFFVNSWNEFVWPVLMIRSAKKYTLSLALQMYISSEGGTDFTIAMSVSILTMIVPIVLFLIFQRQIISTFSTSGLK